MLEQTRLSILRWNPGPRRGREGALEEHIAGKWHVIALQEAVEYLKHASLTNHFYITHFAGCAVMFSNDTFHSDITVKSIYFHDNRNGVHQTVRRDNQDGYYKLSSPVLRSGGYHEMASLILP